MPESKTTKGGFVHFDANAQMGPAVAFQFNPGMLERVIIGVDPASQQSEIVKFVIEFDGTDALERGDATASAFGIHPALAALEVLVQTTQEAIGSMPGPVAGGPARAKPFTLFVWGSQRIYPAKFMHFEVRETMFDGKLNPLRATVSIWLELLNDAELNMNPSARAFMDSYLGQKKWLAARPGSSGPTEEMLTALKR
jgi:hypothetical protein